MRSPLAISVGDPAGVGPIVTADALAKCLGDDRAIVFGDAGWMKKALAEAGFASTVHDAVGADTTAIGPGEVSLVHVADWSEAMMARRAPAADAGNAQRLALDAACDVANGGTARALVTGPVSKKAIDLSGTPFRGQTEHLAARTGLQDDAVTMMFLGPRLNVALVATHWSIANVPSTVTEKHVIRTARHLAEALLQLNDGPGAIRIVVTGLNPHAGEGGVLGNEERDTIGPAVGALRGDAQLAERVQYEGPIAAEAAFRFAADRQFDGVVAMYHDQATIPSKLLDWGQAVNVTWGLPFVRTSVDHGVAYDAAAHGSASSAGMVAAIVAAQRLTDEPSR